jgi:hypothetical protein
VGILGPINTVDLSNHYAKYGLISKRNISMNRSDALDIANNAADCDIRDLVAAQAFLEKLRATDAQIAYRLVLTEINNRSQ